MIDKQCSQLHGMGVVILCLLNIILGEKFTFNYTYITMSQKCKYAPGQEGGLTLEGGCIHLSGHLLLSNSNRWHPKGAILSETSGISKVKVHEGAFRLPESCL